MKFEVEREYRSRRGERVLITAIDPQGTWPIHYLVLSGPYKGVGARDGSRLTRDGRARLLPDGGSPDHWNDLVAEYVETDQAQESEGREAPRQAASLA